MVIPVNNDWHISSTPTCWQVEKYKGKRKDGSERWEPHIFCVDFKNALVALAELQIRLIDTSVPDEIKSAIRQIRDECVSASEVFRELDGRA